MHFMGLILWIDNNQFAASLVEKVFKKRGLAFYTLTDAKDFSYLVDDLKPELIVLDRQTALNSNGLFQKQYEASAQLQKTNFMVLGSWEGLEFIQHKLAVLPREFDPFEMPDRLTKLAREQ